MSNHYCLGCSFYYKPLNICTNPDFFKNNHAQILKKENGKPVPRAGCTEIFTGKSFVDEKQENKYKNKKKTVDNIVFDSTNEANRYCELKLLLWAGEISDLELQPAFDLKLNKKQKRFYIADFKYFDKKKQKYVVEDVKGVKTDVYKLKKVRFLELYPEFEFIEIF